MRGSLASTVNVGAYLPYFTFTVVVVPVTFSGSIVKPLSTFAKLLSEYSTLRVRPEVFI